MQFIYFAIPETVDIDKVANRISSTFIPKLIRYRLDFDDTHNGEHVFRFHAELPAAFFLAGQVVAEIKSEHLEYGKDH